LRLDVAAALAFPDGSMGAPGLRRERDRGRLVTLKIAGKDYTTLADIEQMIEMCRLKATRNTAVQQQVDLAASQAAFEMMCRDLRAARADLDAKLAPHRRRRREQS
jgi:hypothetical protein